MGYGVLKTKANKASLIAMGVIDLRKIGDMYLRLGTIFKRVTGIIDEYLPDEVAIEAPFFDILYDGLTLFRIVCTAINDDTLACLIAHNVAILLNHIAYKFLDVQHIKSEYR